MRTARKVKILVASPADVLAERHRVGALVDRLNRELSDALEVVIERIGWDTHTTPGMGRPQSHISPLVDECDIFVGVLWHRFGTPPGETSAGAKYESGTEEEFERALARWKQNGAQDHSIPRILMYFSDRVVHLSDVDPLQAARVRDFRRRFEPGGPHQGLYRTYKSLDSFEHLLHQHLLTLLFTMIGGTSSAEVISDFVEMRPEQWKDLFDDSMC